MNYPKWHLIVGIFCFITLFTSWGCQNQQIKPTKIASSSDTKEIANDTLIDSDLILVIGPSNCDVSIMDTSQIDSTGRLNEVITHKNYSVLSKNCDRDQFEIFIKYNPKSAFEDYKVSIWEKDLAQPDFSTNEDAIMYRTRIRNECANGVNFGGHFTFVTWGCGSPCQGNVIVDRITGRISDIFYTSVGSNYRKNSTMVILNFSAIDTATNLITTCAYCGVSLENWTGNKFELIE